LGPEQEDCGGIDAQLGVDFPEQHLQADLHVEAAADGRVDRPQSAKPLKLALDLDYVARRSFLLDVRILVQTVFVIFEGPPET